MAPSFSRLSSGALLLALAYNARPVKADFWQDVDNCELVLNDLPWDLTESFCHDWTHGYEPEDEYVTVTGYPVTITQYGYAETCYDDGYPKPTPYPSYNGTGTTSWASETTSVPSNSTSSIPSDSTSSIPSDSTSVTSDASTTTSEQPPPTEPPSYDGGIVTVTSTILTTYTVTSTIYPDSYPTPAPVYRRHARQLVGRAAWCIDRPCRLVQYDDDTIFEACKKHLGLLPETKTIDVPGYTVTVDSYPTDCKKDYGYEEGYVADPYPTKAPEYDEYPAEDSYEEDHSYDEEPSYDDGSEYDNGSDVYVPLDNKGSDDYEDSDDSDNKAPWDSDFENNYSGPDGPKPYDDVDKTTELADAIEAGGQSYAEDKLGLADAPWNALPSDYEDEKYQDDGGDYEPKGDDYKVDNSYDDNNGDEYHEEPEKEDYPADDSYDDSYEPEPEPEYSDDSYDDSYEPEPEYPAEESYDDSYEPEPEYPEEKSYDDSYEPEPEYADEESYEEPYAPEYEDSSESYDEPSYDGED